MFYFYMMNVYLPTNYVVLFLFVLTIFFYYIHRFQDKRQSKWKKTPNIFNLYFKTDSVWNFFHVFFQNRFDPPLMVSTVKKSQRDAKVTNVIKKNWYVFGFPLNSLKYPHFLQVYFYKFCIVLTVSEIQESIKEQIPNTSILFLNPILINCFSKFPYEIHSCRFYLVMTFVISIFGKTDESTFALLWSYRDVPKADIYSQS